MGVRQCNLYFWPTCALSIYNLCFIHIMMVMRFPTDGNTCITSCPVVWISTVTG